MTRWTLFQWKYSEGSKFECNFCLQNCMLVQSWLNNSHTWTANQQARTPPLMRPCVMQPIQSTVAKLSVKRGSYQMLLVTYPMNWLLSWTSMTTYEFVVTTKSVDNKSVKIIFYSILSTRWRIAVFHISTLPTLICFLLLSSNCDIILPRNNLLQQLLPRWIVL